MKTLGRILLGLGAAALFLWLALRNAELAEIGEVLASVRAQSVALALLALALGYGLRVWRWVLLLRCVGRDPAAPSAPAAKAFLASFALNNVLPFRLGDVLRAFGLSRHLGVAPSALTATLLQERLLDLTVLLGILAGIVWVGGTAPLGEVAAPILRAGLGLAVLGAIGILVVPGPLAHLCARLRTRLHPGTIGRKILRFAFLVFRALRKLSAPRWLAPAAALSLLAWAAEGVVFLVIAREFIGGAISAAPWFSMTLGSLMTLVPGSPGHVGTFHFGAQLGFEVSGATPVAAAAAAVLVHAILWAGVTTAGGLALLSLWWQGHIWRRPAATETTKTPKIGPT